MSRVLADLLGPKDHLLFSDAVGVLEAASGHPSEDIRASADIGRLVHQKTKELGLDPRDSTEKELFHGLQSTARLHDEFLAKAVGIKSGADANEIIESAIKTVRKMDLPQACWALKPSVAKRLIKTLPPKRLMKELGYKSVESMLKREQIADIYAAAFHVEADSWAQGFSRQYKQVQPGDFERRKIELRVLSGNRWAGVATRLSGENGRAIIVSKQLGAIVAVPRSGAAQPGFTLAFITLLLWAINYLRTSSAYIQLHQVKPEFGRRIQDVFSAGSPTVAVLKNQPLRWQVLQRYLARHAGDFWPDVFDPHLITEDVSWIGAEDALYKLEPALKFWQGLDWIGRGKTQPVSFNLIDNALSCVNGSEYGQHSTAHMRENLWQELLARYLNYEGVRDDVMRQLEATPSPLASKTLKWGV